MNSQNQFCAYYEASGRIRFKSTLRRGVEPPSVDDLEVLVLDEDFDASACSVVNGALAEGAVVDPQASTAEMIAKRFTRDQLLRASDWTQAADSPLSQPSRAAWAAYRQALRDLPLQAGWPRIELPEQPQG